MAATTDNSLAGWFDRLFGAAIVGYDMAQGPPPGYHLDPSGRLVPDANAYLPLLLVVVMGIVLFMALRK